MVNSLPCERGEREGGGGGGGGGVRQIGEVVTSHLGSADVYSDAVTTVNSPPPCL